MYGLFYFISDQIKLAYLDDLTQHFASSHEQVAKAGDVALIIRNIANYDFSHEGEDFFHLTILSKAREILCVINNRAAGEN